MTLPASTLSRLAEIVEAAEEAHATGADPNNALWACLKALKRAKKRMEALPEDWQRVEFACIDGPAIEFTGKLLASREVKPDSPRVVFEIWQTEAGALVAADIATHGDGGEVVKALVVERQDDMQAMHVAVMEHFRWSKWARSMARKLDWDLRRDVE